MPIHEPGPRLGSTITFRHLARGGNSRRSVYAALNVTAFVDMMTMLVVFLLATFSATGEILMSQKGVELPVALNRKDLERAPIITITRDQINFNDGTGSTSVGDPRAIADDTSTEWKIVELADRLQMAKFNLEKEEIPEAQKAKLRGLVVLQADKGVEAKVLNRVMKTAYSADYTDVMFAVQKKKGEAPAAAP